MVITVEQGIAEVRPFDLRLAEAAARRNDPGEDGGLGVIDADQVAAKQRFDPAGLLNPGKLRGWEERR